MSDSSASLAGRQPQAIRTALAVLRVVARAGPGVTAQQVSLELKLPPATTYRILNLLVGEEYLVRLPDLRGFALGARVGDLIGAPESQSQPEPGVESIVAALRSSTELPVTIAAYVSDGVRIAVPDARRPINADDLAVANLHASALGRLLLAAAPDWRALMPDSALRAVTARTITDRRRLDRELAAVRRSSVAVQIGELHAELGCVAVPVTDQTGTLRAAVTVSADAGALEGRLGTLISQLRVAAADLQRLLPAAGRLSTGVV
jgi:DNA-binding IclR family transcriptional regulator